MKFLNDPDGSYDRDILGKELANFWFGYEVPHHSGIYGTVPNFGGVKGVQLLHILFAIKPLNTGKKVFNGKIGKAQIARGKRAKGHHA